MTLFPQFQLDLNHHCADESNQNQNLFIKKFGKNQRGNDHFYAKNSHVLLYFFQIFDEKVGYDRFTPKTGSFSITELNEYLAAMLAVSSAKWILRDPQRSSIKIKRCFSDCGSVRTQWRDVIWCQLHSPLGHMPCEPAPLSIVAHSWFLQCREQEHVSVEVDKSMLLIFHHHRVRIQALSVIKDPIYGFLLPGSMLHIPGADSFHMSSHGVHRCIKL